MPACYLQLLLTSLLMLSGQIQIADFEGLITTSPKGQPSPSNQIPTKRPQRPRQHEDPTSWLRGLRPAGYQKPWVCRIHMFMKSFGPCSSCQLPISLRGLSSPCFRVPGHKEWREIQPWRMRDTPTTRSTSPQTCCPATVPKSLPSQSTGAEEDESGQKTAEQDFTGRFNNGKACSTSGPVGVLPTIDYHNRCFCNFSF